MEFHRVFGIFPALVFYTEKVTEGRGGETNYFIVRIRPKYKKDGGLLVHELCHVKQWWVGIGPIMSYMYRFIPSFRYNCEIEAYAKQLVHYKGIKADEFNTKINLFAGWIRTKYNLDSLTINPLMDLRLLVKKLLKG